MTGLWNRLWFPSPKKDKHFSFQKSQQFIGWLEVKYHISFLASISTSPTPPHPVYSLKVGILPTAEFIFT